MKETNMIWVQIKPLEKGDPKPKKRTIGRVRIDLGGGGPFQIAEHLFKHVADVVAKVSPPNKGKAKIGPAKDGGEK